MSSRYSCDCLPADKTTACHAGYYEDGVAEQWLEVIKSTNRHLLQRDTTEQWESFQNAVGRHPQYLSVHLLSYHQDHSITWCAIINDQVDTEPCKHASISRTSINQKSPLN